jgi:FMN-dependent oxidoreductase (nitrilotriacetate monooxygenase family)
VTGYLDSAARNLGLSQQLSHDERYDLADEYLDVVYKLWEKSWEDDAVQRDKVSGVFTDPSRVHPINHQGKYFKVPGFHLCEPSPQRTPLLFQAGTSKRGTAFAARHAECTFVSGPSKKVVKKYVDDTRQAMRAAGRDPNDVLVYSQALIITAPTSEEAQAKYEDYCQYIDIEASLTLLSGWTGVDFSAFPLDATIEYIESDAGRTALASFSAADPDKKWTVRAAAEFVGLGGRGPVLIGNPSAIADQLEQWMDETDIDGFNLAYAIAHETVQDVVDLIVPELQKRGRYQTAYTEGSLRHQLFKRGARLPEDHVGRKVTIST